MKFFEPVVSTEPFDLFGLPHLTALGILGILCVFIVVFRRKLIGDADLERRIRYLLVVALMVQQCTYYLWNWYAGEFLLSQMLPLNLCACSVFLSIYALITLDRRVFSILYFFGMCGAFQALLTPSMDGYNFPHFRFFQFFIGHICIVVAVVYLMAVFGIAINIREFGKTLVWLQIFGCCALAGNLLTGGNYMFLSHKPDSASVLDYLSDWWPVYLAELELVAFLFMGLFAVPFSIRQGRKFWEANSVIAANQPVTSLDGERN